MAPRHRRALIDSRAGIDLTSDYLLMRKIAWEKCEKLADFDLIKKGEDLLLEGNFLRMPTRAGPFALIVRQ